MGPIWMGQANEMPFHCCPRVHHVKVLSCSNYPHNLFLIPVCVCTLSQCDRVSNKRIWLQRLTDQIITAVTNNQLLSFFWSSLSSLQKRSSWTCIALHFQTEAVLNVWPYLHSNWVNPNDSRNHCRIAITSHSTPNNTVSFATQQTTRHNWPWSEQKRKLPSTLSDF